MIKGISIVVVNHKKVSKLTFFGAINYCVKFIKEMENIKESLNNLF